MDLLFSFLLCKYQFDDATKFQLHASLFGNMAMQIAHRGSCLKPETRVFARDLRFLSPCHRCGLTFFIYFFINTNSIMLPSFSFIETDLAIWQCKLHIGVMVEPAKWDRKIFSARESKFRTCKHLPTKMCIASSAICGRQSPGTYKYV